jgi:beta-glucosidase
VTPLQGIKNRAGAGIDIEYTQGGEINAGGGGARAGRAGRGAAAPAFDAAGELAKAVDLAKKADVVILYVGTDLAVEGEGHDRPSLGLPGNQQQLVDAVIAANPKTVVVEMNAGPLAVPSIAQNAAALVEAWWGGEEGGNAVADVLFGDVNPSGHMPLTVYASAQQVPPQDQYDITKGYTYMYLKDKPLFAFGHGLSYTQFKYDNLQLASKTIKDDGKVEVSVDITNTGSRAGDEVAQLYTHQVKCSVVRAARELRGFQRVSLQPGEKKTITLDVPAEKLAFYDETVHKFVVEPGAFDIMVGSASDDIRLTDQVQVTK